MLGHVAVPRDAASVVYHVDVVLYCYPTTVGAGMLLTGDASTPCMCRTSSSFISSWPLGGSMRCAGGSL